MQIKTSLFAISLLCVASSAAFAQAKAPEPDYTLSYNLGATTDYRYRGISQSGKKPALQGGADFAHKNGFYAGAWGSTITWIKDSTSNPNNTKGPLEVDLYGGYKGEFSKAIAYDVGALQYWYPTNTLKNSSANADTFELYGAVTVGGIFTAKYSHSLTNLFGAAAPGINSKGSGYLDLSATVDLGNGWSVVPHIGHQNINNFTSYKDYSFTVNKDIDGLVLSGALIGTNIKSKTGAAATLPGSGSKDLGKGDLVLSIKKNF
jgi:uncharacterized protein (TIGR02001 family)